MADKDNKAYKYRQEISQVSESPTPLKSRECMLCGGPRTSRPWAAESTNIWSRLIWSCSHSETLLCWIFYIEVAAANASNRFPRALGASR